MSPWFTNPFFIHLINWGSNECYHAARFEKDSRYYVIRLNKDLLEDWVITSVNGRIRSKLGQNRVLAFSSFRDALEHFYALSILHYQRGYQLKTIACDHYLTLHLLPYMIDIKEQNTLTVASTIKIPNQRPRKATKPASVLEIYSYQTPAKQLGFLF